MHAALGAIAAMAALKFPYFCLLRGLALYTCKNGSSAHLQKLCATRPTRLRKTSATYRANTSAWSTRGGSCTVKQTLGIASLRAKRTAEGVAGGALR